MKFLWISRFGDSVALAQKVAREGNEVDLFIMDRNKQECAQGLINRIDDWRTRLSKDSVIVYDMPGSGKFADAFRKQGYPVFGGSTFTDQLELDRTFGNDFMRVAGIHTPKTTTFTSFDDAIKFVRKTGQKYVFKPNGNMNCALTYVSYNDEDMVHFLEGQKNNTFRKIEFELQCVQNGVEVSCEGLFDGNDWVPGWFNITMERKREMNEDHGKNTGCSVDVVKVLDKQFDSPMVKKTLLKITPALRSASYQGLIDLNSIYFNGSPFGLEWTPRFGINATLTLMELLRDDLGRVIADIAMGNKYIADMSNMFASSVRVCCPDKPKIEHRLVQNIEHFKHIHPMDLMLNENGQFVMSKGDNIIAIVTSAGETIESSATNTYNVIKKVDNFGMIDAEYRTDCGIHARQVYDKLQSWDLF